MTREPIRLRGADTLRDGRERRFSRLKALSRIALVVPVLVFSVSAWAADDDRAVLAEDAAAAYASALDLIRDARYSEALASLRHLARTYPRFDSLPAVQTRIAVLHENRDAGVPLARLLDALERRDVGDVEAAVERLDGLVRDFPDVALTDDALYLAAYFRVMDRYEFEKARVNLLTLGRRFPDTAYRDSAVYLDAIALEQLGDTDAARVALSTLRERHTALSLPFAFRWPEDNMLSRYWFDRADRRLDIIERRLEGASTLRTRAPTDDGRLRLDVSVAGRDMTLVLSPSPLVEGTAWLDAGLADRSPPSVGVYDGKVLGEENSWVRAVVREESITGLVEIDGERFRLVPSNLVGTLDYYLPKPGGGFGQGDGSTLAEVLEESDALLPPPALGGALPGSSSVEGISDFRAVPLSVVVDSQFDRYHAGAGLAVALNDLNVADGIYRSFGLSLVIDEVLIFDDSRDPMSIGPVTLEALLRTFRGYRLAQKTLFDGSALTYLFSGNPKTDVTLGLAWIDTLCRSDGYDVGVATPSTFGDVLVTHELGHSLGAQHDSDTSCRADSDFLMWPNISERTPTTLSPCSETSVRQARTRSCLLNAVDLSLWIEDAGDGVRFLASNSDSTLAVPATLSVETGEVRREGWPDGCQARTPTSADCVLGLLEPGETREFLLAGASGSTVGGDLVPEGVIELDPQDNAMTLDGDRRIVLAESGSSLPRDSDPNDNGSSDNDVQTVADASQEIDRLSEFDEGSGPTLAGGREGGAGSVGLLFGAVLWVVARSRRRITRRERCVSRA